MKSNYIEPNGGHPIEWVRSERLVEVMWRFSMTVNVMAQYLSAAKKQGAILSMHNNTYYVRQPINGLIRQWREQTRGKSLKGVLNVRGIIP